MELLGLESSVEVIKSSYGRLPPKIWRAIMLNFHGFPVTDYLIINLGNIRIENAMDCLNSKLASSKYGLVIRTVSNTDTKSQPYHWLRKSDMTPARLLEVMDALPSNYLMAFAPQAIPKNAVGFAVGRYLTLKGGTRIIEYVQDEIEPRALQRAALRHEGKGKYGRLIKEPGKFFRPEYSTSVEVDVFQALRRYEEHTQLLEYTLRKANPNREVELCLEFTVNCHQQSIEFHDFDF